MSYKSIPKWVKRAAITLMVGQGVGTTSAADRLVPVPEGTPIRDPDGTMRPARKGEQRRLGDFISWRTLMRLRSSPKVKALLAQREQDHADIMLQTARKNDLAVGTHIQPMIQGLRPVVDEYGRVVKRRVNGPDGHPEDRVLYERIPAQVQVQAMQVAGRVSERVSPPTQRLELEHSGSVSIASPEEVEAARMAMLERLLKSREAE